MALWKEILKLGPQGILDQAMGKAVAGIFKGVGGFVSGTGRGMTRQASNVHNWSGIGKVTSSMGYGVGKVANGVATATAVGVGVPLAGTGYGLYKTLPKDWAWLKNAGYKTWRGVTREVPEELAEAGIVGIGGRIIKPEAAWGLGMGAFVLGGANAAERFDYNMGLKTLTNGIMDYEGVSLTPGSIGASYTPVYNRPRGNGLRDLGVTGDLGFALHNQRRTGQI